MSFNSFFNFFTPKEKDQDATKTESNMSQQNHRSFFKPQETKRTNLQVYVGIDFGTAFTKVAYTIAPSSDPVKYSVKFFNNGNIDDFFLPSVIYYDCSRQKLKFNKTESTDEIIRYFKYTMIDSSLKSNENLKLQETKNSREELFSAFYLGCLISFAKKIILENPIVKRNGGNDIKWYFNMGTPLTEMTEWGKREIYQRVLNVGYELSLEFDLITEIDLNELDSFFSSNRNYKHLNLNTFPELYAEVLLYQQDKNVFNGFYSVIDIGGGTIDIAMFLKWYEKYGKKIKVNCPGKSVKPLGFEILINKTANKNHTIDYDAIKNFYMGRTCFSNNDLVVAWKRDLFEDDLRKSYGKYINQFISWFEEEIKLYVDHYTPIMCFFFGGGKDVYFYKKIIDEMNRIQSVELKNSSFDEFVRNSGIKFEIVNNRLLISQMLAQPAERIQELEFFPPSGSPPPKQEEKNITVDEPPKKNRHYIIDESGTIEFID